MGFNNSIWKHVTAIRSYEDAQRFFDNRKALRSKYWESHQRPLYEKKESASQMKHYRIERHQAGDGTFYYDLPLYDTPLIRYFAPKADGTREVWLRGYNTKASWDWLVNHGWDGYCSEKTTSYGQRVYLYLNPARSECAKVFGGGGSGPWWSAKLVLDDNRRIITERSRHVPVFIRRSSDEDKHNRAALKRRVGVIVELAAMRRETFAEETRVNRHHRIAFAGTSVSYSTSNLLREQRDELLADTDEPLPAEVTNAIISVAHACYVRLVNDAAADSRNYRWHTSSEEDVARAHASVTDDKLQASVVRWLMNLLIGKGSARVPLPQFPSTQMKIPRLTFAHPDAEFTYEDYFADYPPFN